LLGKYALLLPRHRHLDSLLSPWRTQTKTLSRQGPQTHNRDLSEETQDFRFLNSIINASNLTESTSIPKRGEKDFERDATKAQASALDASRNVMHTALSLTPASSQNSRRGAVLSRRSSVRVDNAHGPHFQTIGKGDSKSWIWLLSEEALYLIERGSLDIRWLDLLSVSDEGRDNIEGEGNGDDPLG
jgi:tRNA-splicing endonuclease subunit Sen54